ncbi:MAG: cyclic nucleotide-binding domain-containing protein [Chromatiales bacterium]|jgi:CRP/FNR family transcriptional regulator|nr:MAG: cyclic nucleotide-binding domain-containing protein [Chromatiales bacterium]
MRTPDLPHDVFLDIFDAAPVRDLTPGEVIISAGEPATQVFNIVSGVLRVTRTGTDGRRQVLSFLFRDNFVGLTATDNYFFNVEAVTAARVACCPRRQLDLRLGQDPVAERAFLNMMFRVIEDILDVVYSLGQRTAIERLAVFLLYLRHWRRLTDNLANDADPALMEIQVPMSREDIADFLGLKKETVSRSFRDLEDRGLIQRLDTHRIRVESLDGLRQLAGSWDFSSPRRLTGSFTKP